ncbi:hypothetical protein [cf. Phormidesmis sp. LEGE 11477]|uniref:hypothetical protein n=1 Tax=cf. Phormidesmis sp. LEGE 11477 TaxID=1828680 RepID=UPI00187FC75C|nr:hypothetical protein [cf. Phormidesmis sp. LEGE 11477]MBE9064576.1 hypothetical protein [cf. Phormidesmis sp. LEGE 11477]
MSDERLGRLEGVVEQLSGTIDVLVSEFIRPATQQAFANYERLERLESALETLVGQSLVNAEQIEANQQQIASNTAQIEANQRQIASNTESITRLEATVNDQSQQIQVLIEEGRADRQAQREALAAILSIGGRVETLEQRAS